MKKFAFSFCCVCFIACKSKEADRPAKEIAASPPVAAAPVSATPPSVARKVPPASEGPLNLDEARYQKWVALRKDIAAVIRKGMAENVQGHEVKKDESALQAAADVRGMAKGIQAMTDEMNALRSKYGFTEPEDKRIFEAAGDVSAAHVTQNPMLAPTIAMFKEMATKEGPGKENAIKFLKEQEEREAKELADAKAKYGDGAVTVLSAHLAELQQLQTDVLGAVYGAKK